MRWVGAVFWILVLCALLPFEAVAQAPAPSEPDKPPIIRDYPPDVGEPSAAPAGLPSSVPLGPTLARAPTHHQAIEAPVAGGRGPQLAGPIVVEQDGQLVVCGPEVIDYEVGQPVPYGYEVELHPFPRGLIITGAVVFGSAWVNAVFAGLVLPQLAGPTSSESVEEEYALVAIPVAGPFIGLGGSPGRGIGAWLAVMAVGETLGVATLGFGLAGVGTKRLVKRDLRAFNVRPWLGQGLAGLGLSLEY